MKKVLILAAFCPFFLAGCFDSKGQELAACEVELAKLPRAIETGPFSSRFLESCMYAKGYGLQTDVDNCFRFHMSGTITTSCYMSQAATSWQSLKNSAQEIFGKEK